MRSLLLGVIFIALTIKLRKYLEKTKDKVLTTRNIRRHFGCYGFSDNLPPKKLGDATMLPLARIKNNHYKIVKFIN